MTPSSSRPARVHPEFVLAVSELRLRGQLTASGAPAALVELAEDPIAFARGAFSAPAPATVASDLHDAAALAWPSGRDAILEAIEDLRALCPDGVPDPHDLARETPADLAAIAVTRAREGDTIWQRALERAFIRLARHLPERVGYEVWARRATTLDKAAFARALAPLSTGGIEPWVAEDPDGTLHAAVFFEERPDARVTIEAGIRQRHVETRLRVDLVTLEPDAGRARVVSVDPRRGPAIAAALANAGLGEVATVLQKPAFTLRPLLDLGPEAIATAALGPRVRAVAVIACQILEPHGERVEARAANALERAAAIVAASEAPGYVHRATFRFWIDGAATPVDAYVELPNRLGISDERFAREVRGALAMLGVMSPGAAADNVATLAGGEHGEWRLREVVGEAAIARLKELALLVAVPRARTPAVAAPAMRASGYTLRAFPLSHPLDEGNDYAMADDLAVRARSVGEAERRTWRLDLARLRDHLAKDLGLEPRDRARLPETVLDLGATRGDRVRVVFATAPPPDRRRAAFAASIAKALLPAHAVVLVPRGRSLGRELTLELDLEEQLGLRSAEPRLRALLDEAFPAAPEVVLSIPGTWVKQRTFIAINGTACALQPVGFARVLGALAGAIRAPGSWISHGADERQSLHEALYRVHLAARALLPDGMKIVEVAQLTHRLNPEIAIGDIAWERLVENPDPRVQKIAREAIKALKKRS